MSTDINCFWLYTGQMIGICECRTNWDLNAINRIASSRTEQHTSVNRFIAPQLLCLSVLNSLSSNCFQWKCTVFLYGIFFLSFSLLLWILPPRSPAGAFWRNRRIAVDARDEMSFICSCVRAKSNQGDIFANLSGHLLFIHLRMEQPTDCCYESLCQRIYRPIVSANSSHEYSIQRLLFLMRCFHCISQITIRNVRIVFPLIGIELSALACH